MLCKIDFSSTVFQVFIIKTLWMWRTYLRRVGEDISEYFPPVCLPAWHWVGIPVWVVALVLSTWLSTSEKIPFSRSVWLVVGDLTKLRLLGLGSVAVPLLQKLASRLELLVRLAQRAVPVRLGLGKLRYWSVVRALGGRYPSSRAVCRHTIRLPENPTDLGILPTVAEPLVTTAPLAVIVAIAPGAFLKPKVLVGVRVVELRGGFLVSSTPVEWVPLERPFSDTLASSVLPVGWSTTWTVKQKMKSHFQQFWIQ